MEELTKRQKKILEREATRNKKRRTVLRITPEQVRVIQARLVIATEGRYGFKAVDLADMLGVRVDTVYRFVREGKLTPYILQCIIDGAREHGVMIQRSDFEVLDYPSPTFPQSD